MKLIAIKTKNNVYISDNIENKGYHSSLIPSHFFNGQKATATYKSDWFSIPEIPESIEKKMPDKYINIRWELKAGYPVSELTPAVITENPTDDESQYYEVNGLYSKKFETEIGGLEVVPFEISIIAEEDNFQIVRQDFPVSNSIIDQVTFNPVLLPTRPCKLSSEEFYKVVRAHIKANINPKYATISSDYDFCLTVQKVLALHKPEPYKVDVGTKRRPNIQVRYNQTKTISVYATAPKPYSGYTVISPIIGDTYEDLQQKVKEYLSELIEKINKPISECGNCKGTGVIVEK